MAEKKEIADRQKSLDEMGSKKLQAEKDVENARRRINGYKGKMIFKTVMLVLLLIVAGVTYKLATSEGFVASITEKLVGMVAAEEEKGFWVSAIEESLQTQPGQVEEFVIILGSAFVCIVLATIGAGGTGIGWGLISALVGICGMVYIFGGTHIMGYLPIPVCILAVLIKIRDTASNKKYWAGKLTEAEKARDGINSSIAAENASIAKLEADIAKGNAIYAKAVENGNDEELMRKAAELGNEQAVAFVEELEEQRNAEEAERIYQQAMEQEEPNPDLLEKAAEKGHPLANLYLGKELCREVSTGIYTGREKESMLRQAVDYLEVAMDAGSVEAEFFAISCRIQYESNTENKWHDILNRLRILKKSGLSEEYDELYTTMVQGVVDVIDKLNSTPPPPPKKEPRLVRKYCAFNNCGLCTHYSTSSYLAKCNYLNNPGDCSAALLEKALRYEFE